MPNRAQTERVNRFIEKWKPRLLLSTYSITVVYEDEDSGTDRDQSKTLAMILVDTKYTDAAVHIFPAFFTRPVDAQELTILHELLHIHTWSARDWMLTLAAKKVIPEKRVHDIIESNTEVTAKMLFVAYKRSKKSKDFHL